MVLAAQRDLKLTYKFKVLISQSVVHSWLPFKEDNSGVPILGI